MPLVNMSLPFAGAFGLAGLAALAIGVSVPMTEPAPTEAFAVKAPSVEQMETLKFDRTSAVTPIQVIAVEAAEDYEVTLAEITSETKPKPEKEKAEEKTEAKAATKSDQSDAKTETKAERTAGNDSAPAKKIQKKTVAKKATANAPAPVKSTGAKPAGTTPASAKALAKEMLADRGMGDEQFKCLLPIWEKESGWNYKAANPTSSARGIPQAMMSVHFGGNWRNSAAGQKYLSTPETQIAWGLRYIESSYGSPCAAWSKWQSQNWY